MLSIAYRKMIKTAATLAIVLVFMVGLLPVNPARAAGTTAVTWYVRTGGSDTLCNGTVDVDYSAGVTPNCAFKTIQKGVDSAADGDTVTAAPGQYRENVIIGKSLTVVGQPPLKTLGLEQIMKIARNHDLKNGNIDIFPYGADPINRVIVDGDTNNDGVAEIGSGFTITSGINHVEIMGFYLRHFATDGFTGGFGVSAPNSIDVGVLFNTFTNCETAAVDIENTIDSAVAFNDIIAPAGAYGIRISDFSRTQVVYNQVKDGYRGIGLFQMTAAGDPDGSSVDYNYLYSSEWQYIPVPLEPFPTNGILLFISPEAPGSVAENLEIVGNQMFVAPGSQAVKVVGDGETKNLLMATNTIFANNPGGNVFEFIGVNNLGFFSNNVYVWELGGNTALYVANGGDQSVTDNTFYLLFSRPSTATAALQFENVGGSSTINDNMLQEAFGTPYMATALGKSVLGYAIKGTPIQKPDGAYVQVLGAPLMNYCDGIRIYGSGSGDFAVTGNFLDAGGFSRDGYGVWVFSGDVTPFTGSVTLTDNTITGWAYGVNVGSDVTGVVAIHNNQITGNTSYGIYNAASPITVEKARKAINLDGFALTNGDLMSVVKPEIDQWLGLPPKVEEKWVTHAAVQPAAGGTLETTIDATGNWFGSPSGPGGAYTGDGDKITGMVDLFPWCLNNTCTQVIAAESSFVSDGYNQAALELGAPVTSDTTVNIYRSPVLVIDGSSTLLGSVVINSGNATQVYTIGSGAGNMPLPTDDADVSEDYYLLAELPGGVVAHLVGAYHIVVITAAGGSASGVDAVKTPIFVHGTEGADAVSWSGLTMYFGGAVYLYNAQDVSQVRMRLHGGDDMADASTLKFTAAWAGRGNDILTGGLVVVEFHGGLGDDMLTGSNQDDVLYGDEGNDIFLGGLGNDQLYGGEGSDFLRGGKGDDILDGGPGNDTVSFNNANTGVRCDLRGQPGAVCTGEGADKLFGIENLIGGPYNDILNGDNNGNYLNGVTGNDDLYGMGGNDTLEGGSGDDRLWGGAGDDILQGSYGSDQLYGESGNDILGGSFGNDIMDGGSGGANTTNFNSPAGVMVDLGITVQQDTGGQGKDIIRSCQNLIGSPFNDVLIGTDGANHIRGLAGDDLVLGMGGNDLLDGGPGNNRIDGNGAFGLKTLTYAYANAGVVVDLEAGTATGGFGDGAFSDILFNIQNIMGSPYYDELYGDGNSNVIDGGGGSDIMNGRGWIDTLSFASYKEGVYASLEQGLAFSLGIESWSSTISGFENITGSPYNDLLEGNRMDNVLDGGLGWNAVTFQHTGPALEGTLAIAEDGITAVNGVIANLQNQTATGRGNDTIRNFEILIGSMYDDILTGTIGDNIIHGLGGNDMINGNPGNDYLFGGEGDDVLIGGKGGDFIDGGPGIDKVTYLTSTAGVNVDLMNNTANNDGFGFTDSIYNVENLEGSRFTDRLVGDDNDNIIWGMGSSLGEQDVLVGNAGADELRCGAGGCVISSFLENNNTNPDFDVDHLFGGRPGANVGYFTAEDIVVNIP
jgi:Ca2+-binding RTX toxin-like protein